VQNEINSSDELASIYAKSAAKELTLELRDMAVAAGWPPGVAGSLSVVLTNGTLNIDYPESMEERIQDLEYGSFEKPPMSVFRKFMYRTEQVTSQILGREVLDNLIVEAGVF
jgi:hypothetical protein